MLTADGSVDINKCLVAQAERKERKADEEAAVKAPPADIRRYLRTTGLMETRYVRMLSSLCAETYYLNKLSVRLPCSWQCDLANNTMSVSNEQSWTMSATPVNCCACTKGGIHSMVACGGHVHMPTQLFNTQWPVCAQKRTLFLRHRLHLVTTSHEAAGHAAREVPRTALQTMDEGDAMAASPCQASSARDDLLEASQRPVPAMQVLGCGCSQIFLQYYVPTMRGRAIRCLTLPSQRSVPPLDRCGLCACQLSAQHAQAGQQRAGALVVTAWCWGGRSFPVLQLKYQRQVWRT